jgi:2'-5' RNA ligase
MHLAGTGTFRPLSPVVFIQIATGVSDCVMLEQRIRRGVLARDLEFPYHPHVTVAQGIADDRLDEAYDGLAGFVARFRVEGVVLFSRDPDGRWQWGREFRLGGTGDTQGG